MVRLDKYLADAGIGTRSEVKKIIKAGKVKIDNEIIKDPNTKFDENKSEVSVNSMPISKRQKFRYFMLNKPQGVVSATEDNFHKTVLDVLYENATNADTLKDTSATTTNASVTSSADASAATTNASVTSSADASAASLAKVNVATTDSLATSHDLSDLKKRNLFPVGRLDIDTEGLLLITDDGELSHSLLSPKKHVDKTYYAVVSGKVTKEDIEIFSNPMDIGKTTKNSKGETLSHEEEIVKPAKLEIIRVGTAAEILTALSDKKLENIDNGEPSKDTSLYSEIHITIQEGKFHQVKRMFQKINKPVCFLKRISMGNLTLDPSLPTGQYREIQIEEIIKLK